MEVGKVDEDRRRRALRARAARSSERSAPRSAGSFSKTSEMPTTESASDRTTVSSPAAASRAPPIPNAVRPGRRGCERLEQAGAVEVAGGLAGGDQEVQDGINRSDDRSATRGNGIHQPRHREPAEHERGHQHPEELPALPAVLPPEEGEEGGHEKRVERHDQEVVGREEARS